MKRDSGRIKELRIIAIATCKDASLVTQRDKCVLCELILFLTDVDNDVLYSCRSGFERMKLVGLRFLGKIAI